MDVFSSLLGKPRTKDTLFCLGEKTRWASPESTARSCQENTSVFCSQRGNKYPQSGLSLLFIPFQGFQGVPHTWATTAGRVTPRRFHPHLAALWSWHQHLASDKMYFDRSTKALFGAGGTANTCWGECLHPFTRCSEPMATAKWEQPLQSLRWSCKKPQRGQSPQCPAPETPRAAAAAVAPE